MENIEIKGKNDPRLPLFSFIASAISKDKNVTRHGIDCIFYQAKKKRIYATDGHRLHIAFIDMGNENRAFRILVKKQYEIVLSEIAKDDIPGSPNISAVICGPDIVAKKEITISSIHPESTYVQLMRLYERHYIQQKFFNDLKLFSDYWTVLIQDEEKAQFFKSGNCMAVMMMIENQK